MSDQEPSASTAAVATMPSRIRIWMGRAGLVLFVMLCTMVGMLLLVLPWTHVWTDNPLLVRWLWLRDLAQNSFLRGAVSGLGLVDIGMGIFHGMTYTEPGDPTSHS